MLAVLVSTLISATPPSDGHVIDVDERVPSVLLVITPGGLARASITSALVREASIVTKSLTDIRLLSPEQAGANLDEIKRCDRAERVSCWVRSVRRAGKGSSAAYVFVVSAQVRSNAKSRLSMMTIETGRVQSILTDYRDHPDAKAIIEDRIFESAIHTPPVLVDTESDSAIRGYFDQLFNGPLRSHLEDARHWQPFGRLRVQAEAAGWTIRIDGRAIGATTLGTTTVFGLQPGSREVVVEAKGTTLFKAPTAIAPGVEASIQVEAPKERHVVRNVAGWSGVAMTAAGVGLAIFAGARGSGGLTQDCLQRPGDSGCTDVGLTGFGQDSSLAPTANPGDVDGSPVLVLPLGLALAGTGVSWGLGAWLEGQESDIPWWSIAIGVGVGVLAYSIPAAVGG